MEDPTTSFSNPSEHDQAFNPLGLSGQQHLWNWDLHHDPATVLGSLRDPFDLFSADLDKASPLPSSWGGIRVVPVEFEFWQGRENRLHDRFRYGRDGDGWAIERLAP